MSSPGGSITRKPLIFIAGALLILSGVVGTIAFLRVLGGGTGPVEVLYLIIGLLVAALSIYAGWLVLRQEERGRSLGVVLSVVGLVLGLLSLLQGSGLFVVGVVIEVFVLFVLVTRAEEFA